MPANKGKGVAIKWLRERAKMVSAQGGKILHGVYKCQRDAMSHLWGVKVGPGAIAELLDSKDDWIARLFGRRAPSLSNGHYLPGGE